MDDLIGGWMYEWDGWMDVCDIWIDGLMDEWDGWMYGWKNG